MVYSEKRLTVTLDRVSVQVNDVGEDFAPTCLSVLAELNPFGRHKPAKRTILRNVSCQIRPGEMMLICGRPGSGCTSLLKIISNYQEEFEAVNGVIRYGNNTPRQAQQFRSQIVMNTEDDIHFPTLKVEETMDFAASTKLSKGHTKKDIASTRDSILDKLGIGHTKSTMVGNEAVRGVSGGERKRVSLAEVMATQAPVQCWDNSTRGLDASNALDFGILLRKAADEEQKTIAATLYQAGNGVYNQFDKVLVLVEGRQIYYGPASEAKTYFEDMGFVCPPGANIGDFVTSVAVHTERKIRPGYEAVIPDTAEDFEERFGASHHYQRMLQEIEACPPSSLGPEIDAVAHARNNERNRSFELLSRETSPYQVSFFQQAFACTVRQLQVMWGDRWSNAMQIASALIMALTTGSLFYDLPEDSTSIFPRPGAIFFPILFFAMNKMSETTASFMGRRIVSRHKRLAFSRPSAFALACTVTDIPLVILTFSLFQVIYYFMTGQRMNAGQFFTSWILLILCVLSFASLYRMIGAWCRHFGFASQLSGWITMVYLLYGGYLIPVPTMHPWFRWINYLNPATYTYEALMANEMTGMILDCVEPQLIPYGPSYNDDRYRGCAVKGTAPGATTIIGSEFVHSQYLASVSHIGRNAGIVIAFWIFFAVMAAVGFELNIHSDSGSRILFTRKNNPKDTSKLEDLEKSDGETTAAGLGQLTLSKTLFTFKDISYFVQHEGKELQLLDKVSGFIKPGQLVALMGSSGAGKTTLMDVLAQRKDSGRIEGSILVNGKPQSITFQRTTGYCEQNDIHEPTATVWESLVFAASLRQSYEVPTEEKLEYVVAIMDLLELTPLRDAIVGSPGSGLSIEQRKRLTLATELVAKPTLLFLDEPTSGLDGQSAHEICRFMRKLASFGQAVICTIHQPSATLFDAFDVLLLLARGGRTTYFGPTGQYSTTVVDYFVRNGVPCPADSNPAEYIVDVVQGRFGTEINWPQMWLDSPERAHTMLELDKLNACAEEYVEKMPGTDDTNTSLDHQASFATPLWYQTKLVTRRQMIALWRNPDYIWNKIGLHVTNGLFGGFTFWMLGKGTFDLQLHLMAILNFIFVAPGCINQMQPLFIQNRDIFETREKKSKTYHWAAFVAGQVMSEIPALILCGTLAFVTWYFTVGFPVQASLSGQVYVQMLMYEFLYTSIGQAIAAYSPNAFFAALANPIILGAALINFCGVVVPYEQIQAFWRYWLYWLDPFTYLVQGLLTPVTWYQQVQCKPDELTYIPLPSNTTCGGFLEDFMANHAGYVTDPGNTTTCAYCEYSTGADYLKTLNIKGAYYGWRSTGITALFCVSSYLLVFLMMKLRTKNTKTAG